jgi:hypothetical protein
VIFSHRPCKFFDMESRKALCLKIITRQLALQDLKCVEGSEIRSENASNAANAELRRQ